MDESQNIMLRKNSNAKQYALCESIYIKYEKLICRHTKISGYPDLEMGLTNKTRGNFQNEENVFYLDWDGGFMGVYICQNSSYCIPWYANFI